MTRINRRYWLVVLVLLSQLALLFVGLSLFESWLGQSVRQAVAQRTWKSQQVLGELLTGEFLRLDLADLKQESRDWQRATDLVANWQLESNAWVAIVDGQTGEVLVSADLDQVGQKHAIEDRIRLLFVRYEAYQLQQKNNREQLQPQLRSSQEFNPSVWDQTVDQDDLKPLNQSGGLNQLNQAGLLFENELVEFAQPVVRGQTAMMVLPMYDIGLAMVIHTPTQVARDQTDAFLYQVRIWGGVVMVAIAIAGAIATWWLLGRYESKLHAINQILEAKVQRRTEQLERNRDAVIFAVARVAEDRDEGTGQHLERISAYTHLLAQAVYESGRYENLSKDWVKIVTTTSILHDIGKVGIPDDILLKPGKLTQQEHQTIQQHTQIGCDTLQAIREQWGRDPFLDTARQIALGHHERWDGTGYPLGMSGRQIPLSARLVAVADVYDALTSERPYKQAHSHEEACLRIKQSAGTHFDPQVVEIFESLSEAFDQTRKRLQDQYAGADLQPVSS